MFNTLSSKIISKKILTKKVIFFVMFITSLIFCRLFLAHHVNSYINLTYLSHYFQQHTVLAPFLFVLIYILLTFSLMPTLPLNIFAGILFGWWLGGLLAAIGSTLGALVAFYIARELLSDISKHKLCQKYEAKYPWLFSGSWQVVAMCRLCLVLPTGLINYLFGLTKVNPLLYPLVTLLFSIPATLIVAALANVAYDYVFDGTLLLLLISLLLLALFFIFIYFGGKLQLALRKGSMND